MIGSGRIFRFLDDVVLVDVYFLGTWYFVRGEFIFLRVGMVSGVWRV